VQTPDVHHQRKFAAIEVGGVVGFIGHHLTLDVPTETIEDDEKTVYTEYTPLGVCGGAQNHKVFHKNASC
jgi:hypothetical protein